MPSGQFCKLQCLDRGWVQSEWSKIADCSCVFSYICILYQHPKDRWKLWFRSFVTKHVSLYMQQQGQMPPEASKHPYTRQDLIQAQCALGYLGPAAGSHKDPSFLKYCTLWTVDMLFFLLFQVFPGSRREVHVFMLEKGFDYVGSLFEDDIFIKKDLNTPERYPSIRSKLPKMPTNFLSQVWDHWWPQETDGRDIKLLFLVRHQARINPGRGGVGSQIWQVCETHPKENVSEDEDEIIKVSGAEEGASVNNMEDVRPSQFEENLAKNTLSDELWLF